MPYCFWLIRPLTSDLWPRASMARAHAGGAALTELHSPSWPCGQEGADGRVIARDSRRGGRRPIVAKESARGGGHQGQRGGSRRTARRSCVWPRPSPRCGGGSQGALHPVKKDSITKMMNRRRRRCMVWTAWSSTPSSATSEALVNYSIHDVGLTRCPQELLWRCALELVDHRRNWLEGTI